MSDAIKIKKFWENVNIKSPRECWLWKGPLSSDKGKNTIYGSFWFNKKIMLAHQISYCIFNNLDKPDGHLFRICKNKLCCNPHHIYKKDKLDKTKDIKKERGQLKPFVKKIRELYHNGETLFNIGRMFNATMSSISYIVYNLSYYDKNYKIKYKNEFLVEDDIKEIFSMRLEGYKQIEIANKFNVTQSIISRYLNSQDTRMELLNEI